MVKSIYTYVGDIFNGTNRAYIYIWFSRQERFVYVGQTNDQFGTWGRGISHVSYSGTLRKRCDEMVGLSLEAIEDLTLCSFLLPNVQIFTGTESSYREAVEYLVQYHLQFLRGNLKPAFKIISNVRASDRITEHEVKLLCESILNQFQNMYSQV